MTMRTRLSRLAAGLAAGLLSCLAQASWLWHLDGPAPTRIEIGAGIVQTAGEPGPVDAFLPLEDGGAWLRRGDEVIRLTPDLDAAARATVVAAKSMHWEPQSRHLWVAAGSDLLRYDDALRLGGVARIAADIRAVAGSGPEAIWVATDSRLLRFASGGELVESFDLVALLGGAPVRGILADTPRARLWAVAATGDVVALDVADGMRPAGARLSLSPGARAVALDAVAGTLVELVDREWRPAGTGHAHASLAGIPAADALQSIGVVRFASGDRSAEPSIVVAAPIVVLDASAARRWHWLPPPSLALAAGAPIVQSNATGTEIVLELEARCGARPCTADPLLASLRATIDLAGQAGKADVRRLGDRWIVHIASNGPLAPGAHPLVVTLADAFGNRHRFDDHDVIVESSGLAQARRTTLKATPLVSITAPANGATFVAPASVTIGATASVSGATLAKVEFYRDGVLLATDTTAPYGHAWTNVAAGTYALTAKAYDSAGGTATSAAVGITVKPNVPPTVSLTAPANNAVLTAPATINLAANAADSDGTIARVEFFNGTTRLATDTAAPYAHAWTNVAGGTYTLTAKATDDKGAVTTSAPVTVIVNRPPATAITAPANNAVLVAPVNLTVTASASDADGTVSKVEFFRNGTLAATDTASPYSFAWSNVPLGTHTLTSKATDNRGATTMSAPVTFTVNANVAPSVAITAPAPGARFVHPASVPIAATATDSDGTIARVEFHYDYGLLASDTSSPYAYTWNSPYTGTFSLTARAVDSKGAVTASAPVSITIAANQPPSVVLTGDPPAGEIATAVPPTFRLTATVADPDGSVAGVRFLRYDTVADAYVEFATVAQPPFTAQYAAPSLESEYWFRAEATDNGGAVGAAEINYMVVANRSPQAGLVDPTDAVEWSGFIAPATVVLVVEAKEFDPAPDRIARVDILANGTVLASLAAPAGANGEFVHVWRDVPAGNHNVVVRAIDTLGAVGEWSRVVKVIDTSRPAAVAIAQPVSGQVYGDPVPLQASVAVGASPVSHVDYVNAQGRKVASSATAPYAASWSAPSPGRHAVTAVAVQADGVAVTSPTVFFDVAATGLRSPPRVVLTAPTALGTVNADAPIGVAADALADRGSSITKVEFFSNGALIGTATTAPYQIAWSGAPAGKATLTAKATDSTAPAAGSTATSSPITVTVASTNPPPAVSLTAPASGTAYAAPATISLVAAASDANGSVSKVEFFAGTTLLGSGTTAPYTFTWSNVPAGTYALTARATDNGGAVATSAAASISVVANAPPQVALTSPAVGQSFAYGAPIPLAATASDADGSVAKVEFFAGATRLATDSSSPYAFTWSNAAVGTHAITARATDNLGTVTTSAPVSVTVTANALPTVALALPLAGQKFVTGQTILLAATAADADGSIALVEFLRDGAVVATAAAPPYTYTWTNAATGSYSIQARAIDNRGAVRTSAGVSISVATLAVTVTSPAENAHIAAASVLVTGTFSAPANSGVLVNGVRARVDGNRFFANAVPLADGPNALSVAVVAADETAVSVTRNVTRTASPPIRIWVEPESGYVPHTATIRAENAGGPAIASVAYENLGGATLDTTGANQETLGRLTLSFATMVTPTVVVTDAAGNVYRQQIGLIAESKSLVDAQLKESWNTYAATLAAGRVDLALASLPPVTAARYKPILEPLAPHFATIVPTWSAPMTGRLADDVGEYTIARTIDGQNRLFFIYFVRDDRGIWRLDSM
jgi:hypothetical protein